METANNQFIIEKVTVSEGIGTFAEAILFFTPEKLYMLTTHKTEAMVGVKKTVFPETLIFFQQLKREMESEEGVNVVEKLEEFVRPMYQFTYTDLEKMKLKFGLFGSGLLLKRRNLGRTVIGLKPKALAKELKAYFQKNGIAH